MASIWKEANFRHNIFSTQPLRINERDSNLLVGRTEQLKNVQTIIDSDKRSIQIITGKYGTGKTSFTNSLQYKMFASTESEKNILPCYRALEIDDETNKSKFILLAILSLCSSIRSFYAKSSNKIPDRLEFEVDYWLGLKTDMHTSGRELELNAQLIKVKASNARESTMYNDRDPHYAFKQLKDQFIAENKSISGVFLSVENLELPDIDTVVRVFDACRDTLFNLDDIHWLLISSDESFPVELFSKTRRFFGITNPLKTHLKELSAMQVNQAIEQRMESAKIDKNIQQLPPFEFEVVKTIYSYTNKDIRITFGILNHLFLFSFKEPNLLTNYLAKRIQLGMFAIEDRLIDFCTEFTSIYRFEEEDRKLLNYVFQKSPVSIGKLKEEEVVSSNAIDINKRFAEYVEKGFIEQHGNSFKDTYLLRFVALANKLGDSAKDLAYNQLVNLHTG